MNPEPISEDYEPRKGWFSRLKDTIMGPEEDDEDEAGEVASRPAVSSNATPLGRPAQALRLQTARGGRVAVRLNAQVMEDAKLAADGLKAGEHQIVNLEKATPQMGERIIDFLNGVCYALDGTVERVGDRVFMYVPANVNVEVDGGAASAARASASSASNVINYRE